LQRCARRKERPRQQEEAKASLHNLPIPPDDMLNAVCNAPDRNAYTRPFLRDRRNPAFQPRNFARNPLSDPNFDALPVISTAGGPGPVDGTPIADNEVVLHVQWQHRSRTAKVLEFLVLASQVLAPGPCLCRGRGSRCHRGRVQSRQTRACVCCCYPSLLLSSLVRLLYFHSTAYGCRTAPERSRRRRLPD
jgi:hypothetical protein